MLHEGGVTWRYAGDARILPFLGRAFLLQVAHPTIAAGVADHSRFKKDPFGRFKQSYGLVLQTLYAIDGKRVGAEVRASHRRITGVTADGRRYHAFEPEAYFWVLATGYETVVVTARRFLKPMSSAEERRAYDEHASSVAGSACATATCPPRSRASPSGTRGCSRTGSRATRRWPKSWPRSGVPTHRFPFPGCRGSCPGRSLGAWRGLRRWEPSAPQSGSGLASRGALPMSCSCKRPREPSGRSRSSRLVGSYSHLPERLGATQGMPRLRPTVAEARCGPRSSAEHRRKASSAPPAEPSRWSPAGGGRRAPAVSARA